MTKINVPMLGSTTLGPRKAINLGEDPCLMQAISRITGGDAMNDVPTCVDAVLIIAGIYLNDNAKYLDWRIVSETEPMMPFVDEALTKQRLNKLKQLIPRLVDTVDQTHLREARQTLWRETYFRPITWDEKFAVFERMIKLGEEPIDKLFATMTPVEDDPDLVEIGGMCFTPAELEYAHDLLP